MTRIFSALALLAVALLASNLLFALAVGDFGAANSKYANARRALDAAKTDEQATLATIRTNDEAAATAAHALRTQRDQFWPHIWLGIIASLVSLLVNSICVTYFIGTSRWCREVSDAYRMQNDLAERSQQLKRRTFPWALLGIVLTLAIAGLGAASDPYSSSSQPDAWVSWHWAVAMGGLVVISGAFWKQVRAVAANYEIIQALLTETSRMRDERQRLAESKRAESTGAEAADPA